MGAVGKERTVSLEDRIARLEAFQAKHTRATAKSNQGHYMRECPDIH